MDKRSNIGKNTIFYTIKTISNVIYPIITFPYISRTLMPDNVGKINFGNSIVSYFSLVASLGITTYAVRECAKVRDNRKKMEDTASQIFSINIISTLVSYIALFIVLFCFDKLKNYSSLICIQSTIILFTTWGADWLNTVMEDFKFISIRTVAMQILSLVAMFIFVHAPEDYLKYAIISVLASSGANIINIFYRRKFCRIQMVFSIEWKKHMPSIMMLFSLVFVQTIYCNSDMTILGLIRDDYEVGLYSTAVKIYNMVNMIVASVSTVLMPRLSLAFSEKNYDEINNLVKYALEFIITLGMPCIVGLNMIATPIICTFAGEKYIDASIPLHILTIALAASLIGGWIGNTILLPAGKEKICTISGTVSAIINIVFNIIFIPKYGMYAAAATTALSEIVALVIVSIFIDKNIHIYGLFNVIKAPIIGSLAIIVIAFIAKLIMPSYINIAIFVTFISIVVYVIILILCKNRFVMSIISSVASKINYEKGE